MKLWKYGLLSLCLFSCSVLANTTTTTPVFNAEQQKAIEKIVHDYFISHPQVLIEASSALQKQQQNQWEQTAQNVIPAHAAQFFESPVSPVAGNSDGNVTLVEFFDYACPHCKDLAPQIQDMVKHDPQLKVIFKPWPIFGETSVYAAKVGLALQKQGKFIAFHEALMSVPTPLTHALVLKIAEQVGANKNQILQELNNPAFEQEIKTNNQLAKALKLTGTPGFVLAKVEKDSQTRKVTAVKNPLLIPGAVSENILVEAVGDVRARA